MLLILTGLHDLLDGPVAKASGTSSVRGAFFDSVTDRVSDALILGGVAWYLVSTHPGHLVLLPFAVLGATSLVSYQRAKAESLGISAKGGLMERAERMILLGIGFLSPSFLVPVLWVMLGLTMATAVGRFVKVWRLAEAPVPVEAIRPAPTSPAYPTSARSGTRRSSTSPSRWRARRQGELASRSGRTWRARQARRVSGSAPVDATADSDRRPTHRGRGLVDKGQVVFRTYTTLARCLAALPEPVALGLGHGVGDLLFAAPRRTAADGLGQPGPGAGGRTTATGPWWTAGHAAPSGPTLATGWKGPGWVAPRPSEVEERTFVQGLEYLADGVAAGQGVIMALPHVGSWEYGGAFLATQDLPMTSVAERIEPPELFEFFVEQRAAMGLTIVPLDALVGKHGDVGPA